MHILKVIPIGDQLGVTLPEVVLAKLGVGLGQGIYLSDLPDGVGISLASSQSFEVQMHFANEVMADRHAALRALSK